ncbi:protein msta-like [Pogonomyrmex barbatus]|uniref:Protein msta-like n=1 Tax=Pogonomyrmex barbatus TaxID=144034 RepID=A0A6I9WBD4_9HYME|nr:protein msta-like [Pogonomyrmex barbatus]XP_011636203.1 protein msta-like [Pogonomyrmex barbatus]XP_011636205.1 protein msta-like [Pogonomyrmex barbatus]
MDDAPKYGVCPVCGKNATLKCGSCRREFYCDKSHQSQDWPRYKSTCCGWEVNRDSSLGRHLVATRDLTSGDVILSETPLVWGPSIHVDQRVCVGCGERCEDIDARCKGCCWPVCKSDCGGLSDKRRHQLECALLARARIIPRCEVLLIIRMLVLWRTKSRRWTTLANLQSHEESRGPGTEAHDEVLSIIQRLGPLLSMASDCKDILPKICGLIDVNALETAPPDGSVAIYENASLLEHSCLANTRHSFRVDDKGRPRITVYAVTSVKRGEHLTTMYTHALWSTRARREHLLATKYFACRCKRCADPTELGTHLGTFNCPCKNGLMLPNDPLNPSTDWSCNLCPGTVTSAEVAQLTDRLEEDVTEVMKQATERSLSDLLSRLMVLLHPGHQHCISVSHSLMQLLPATDPRKLELCKRVMDTVSRLDPYGARLALYTAVTLRELATCPGEDRRAHLVKAASLLKAEPTNSPGEKLRRLIEVELQS